MALKFDVKHVEHQIALKKLESSILPDEHWEGVMQLLESESKKATEHEEKIHKLNDNDHKPFTI